jgi:ABC-type microcin C transport system permease subunit YejB
MEMRVQNVLGVCILNNTISRMIMMVHTMLIVVATNPLAVWFIVPVLPGGPVDLKAVGLCCMSGYVADEDMAPIY